MIGKEFHISDKVNFLQNNQYYRIDRARIESILDNQTIMQDTDFLIKNFEAQKQSITFEVIANLNIETSEIEKSEKYEYATNKSLIEFFFKKLYEYNLIDNQKETKEIIIEGTTVYKKEILLDYPHNSYSKVLLTSSLNQVMFHLYILGLQKIITEKFPSLIKILDSQKDYLEKSIREGMNSSKEQILETENVDKYRELLEHKQEELLGKPNVKYYGGQCKFKALINAGHDLVSSLETNEIVDNIDEINSINQMKNNIRTDQLKI